MKINLIKETPIIYPYLILFFIYVLNYNYFNQKNLQHTTILHDNLDFRISDKIPINDDDRILKIIKIIDKQGNIKEYDWAPKRPKYRVN
ncbi:MAG: hypothetical protein Q8831_02740 ['Bonamia sp.' little leaf phytoplasma]|nr:hypothetical protein ['Bonamia sp.' little leaf phytoplasma]